MADNEARIADNTANTYEVRLVCRNCGNRWLHSYPRGRSVPYKYGLRSMGVNAICPNCGVNDCGKYWERDQGEVTYLTNTPPLPRTIAVDFDGVLSAYKGDFEEGKLDPPLPNTAAFLGALNELGYEVVVYTTRDPDNVWRWLIGYELVDYVDVVTTNKPLAFAYIDDRAICFNGDHTETLRELQEFVAWWEKPEVEI